MLNAMVASTGGAGTCTQPSVAAARVMLCAAVNAVIVQISRREPVDQDHQRENEQKMIDAEQDVLDAQQQIGLDHLPASWLRRDHKAWLRRPHERGLRRTVQSLQPNEHVGERGLQARRCGSTFRRGRRNGARAIAAGTRC